MFFSTTEVSQKLNVSRKTVWNLCKKNKIEYYTVGGSIRIDEKAIEKYLDENVQKTKNQPTIQIIFKRKNGLETALELIATKKSKETLSRL